MPVSRNLSGCQVFHQDKLPGGWRCDLLGARVALEYGVGLTEGNRIRGSVKVYGSNGVVGIHSRSIVKGPGIVVGRKGTVGAIHYSEQPFWPIDTAYFVERLNDDSWRYLYYLLEYLDLGRLNAATGVPGLSRRDALAIRGAFPPRPEQNEIVRILDAADTIIELTRAAIDKACRVKRGLMQDLLPPWVGFKRLPPESLPRGVEVLPAGHREVARVLNGSTPAREQSAYWRGGTIPWMATGKVNERIIAKADEHVTPKALAECSIELLPRGTVLVAMIGQGKTRGMAASGPSSLFIHKYC